jgi:ATP-dependent exoDNAse (exonuclease V) beta subunit
VQRPSFSIYDASAGSGKTYNLVKEYLKIILTAKNHDAYRNILAITFTNKAVHEMKSRIVSSLSEFTKDNPSVKAMDLMQDMVNGKRHSKNPNEWLEYPIGLSIQEIKTKSQQIIKHIIHNYAAFDISTIDKFTHKVIRAFAHDLGLPISFEVSTDTENLLIEAVDSIIAKAGEDAVLTKLLVDFTMEKTDNDKSWDISREIFETGKLILNENNRIEVEEFKGKNIEDFIEIKASLLSEIKTLETANINLGNRIFEIFEKHNIEEKSFSNGTFPNHISYIISGDKRVNNYTFTEVESVKIKKNDRDTAIIIQVLPEILELLSHAYQHNSKKDFYTAFLKNITPLSLLNTVSSELKQIQTEQNVLSISEFNALIHKEIQNQPAPFIYERLGERYRHFFIDEFQDTSEMQWQNLIPLIDNATSSMQNDEKGTLMIVGDPKQSIYRWRGGKAEQFIDLSKENNPLDKSQNPFNNPDKKVRQLEENYRSFSQVIEFNNSFFQGLANEFENEDYKDLYANHSVQKTNSKKGGYVNISFIPKIEDLETSDNEEIENEELPKGKSDLYVLATYNIIKKTLKQRFEYKDIVVLTRKRDQGVAIANYLTAQSIPILSSETLMIANATEVRFIIQILKYLKNHNDREAKAFFLEYLAQNTSIEMQVHDFIADGMLLENEEKFEKWLSGFGFQNSFKNLRKKSLYETVEYIVNIFLNPAKQVATSLHTNGSNSAYVQYFMDIVLEKDARSQAGITDFLDFWDKNGSKFSIPSPEGTNAVKLMTIHKSKGLEFPVVIFPFAEEDSNHKPKDKIWLEADEAFFGLPKVLIDNSKAVSGFGERAKLIYDQKKQEELLDIINVLYVALTRAEEQLYIISSMHLDKQDLPKTNQMSSFFVNYLIQNNDFVKDKLEYDFGSPIKLSINEKHIEKSKNIRAVSTILNPKNIKIAQRESVMWGTDRQEAIEFGNIMHEILSFVKTKSDIDLAITKALENGLITNIQKDIVKHTITSIVNHPELSLFFDSNNIVLNEQTIIQTNGAAIKPDRMVFGSKGTLYLLDYKTGLPEEKHKNQLDNYQEVIEKMDYKVIQKTLVYIGEELVVVNIL